MSITVNVENVGLRELKELYYNDNGTIRELNEFWTNDGTELKCLYPKGLAWLTTNSTTKVYSTDDDGYFVYFKDLSYYKDKKYPEYKTGILSNTIKLSQSQTITVTFTITSTIGGGWYPFNRILLLNSNNSVVKESETLRNTNTEKTLSLTVPSNGLYKLLLCGGKVGSDNSSHAYAEFEAEITIS